MTLDILTAAGEEYAVKNALDSATFTVGLYLDATDGITDSDVDPSTAITTEPSTAGNYARASVPVSAAETSADVWGVENDSSFTFDFSDVSGGSQNVDGAFIIINFTSTEGGSLGDWLIGTVALDQTRDIHQVTSIDYAAGAFEVNFD